jgi:hypothetical protein
MRTPEDCLTEAAECEQLAETAQSETQRAVLLHAAQEWRKLADQCRWVQRRNERARAQAEAF